MTDIKKNILQGKYWGVFVGGILYATFFVESHADNYIKWLRENTEKD